MNTNRYNKIKTSMPDSVRMKLEHIKRYLDEGKAAALVGAGFSKNAWMPEATEMKDWNALGIDFYRRLYGEPQERDLRFQNPINLATQVEASFGRHELDDLIQQSLPDDVILPSRLHVDLLNLGWRDLFTTNYDTLLERACLDADQSYTIVYNKDTLLYSISPRIIKLHGSFPNIRPYIITEEDYRTYPQRYPEFVNTVRQSLIENLFCMIGFSGDDPNFKSWLGWLRDVMGQKISPVYFITYDRNLHDSKLNLLAKQRIEVLNLHDLGTVNSIQEAFDFFFSYMKNEGGTQWSGALKTEHHRIKKAEQVRLLVMEMAEIRNRYPLWLVMPKKYYSDFNDVRSDIMTWGDVLMIEDLKDEDRLQFLYELKWRLEVSLSPIGFDWYVKAIEKLTFNNPQQMVVVADLKLALLKYYRVVGKEKEYEALVAELQSRKDQLTLEQTRRFYYDQCLMASSQMEYEQMRELLSGWQVYETDFVGALWKAAMLMEVDQRGDALNILNKAAIQIRRTILSTQHESLFYKSCQIAIERSLYFYGNIGEYKQFTNCDYLEEMRFFKEKMSQTINKLDISSSHGYNVDDVRITWNLGTAGYKEGYLYPYRYYTLCEQVGIPAGIPNMTMNTEDHKLMLSQWMLYNHYYPIGILVRSCNAQLINTVLNRKIMSMIGKELTNKYFDRFFNYAEQTDKMDDRFIRIHIFQTCIPILARMCSKASNDSVKKMAMYLMKVHGEFGRNEEHIEHQYIKTVYASLKLEDIVDVLANVFEQSIETITDNDYYIPLGWSKHLTFSSIAVQIAVDGLSNPDEKVQNIAFLRAYQILRGSIDDSDRERLMKAIRDWRNSTKQMQYVCFSLIDVPATENEQYSQEGLIKDYIDNLLKIENGEIHNSLVYSNMVELYRQINYCHNILNTINPTVIIKHFSELVHNNEAILTNDNDDLMGGFRKYMSNVLKGFEEFLSFVDISKVDTDVIVSLSDAAIILGRMNYPHISLLMRLVRFNKALKETELKKKIQNNIATSATLWQVMDVAHAIQILHERNRSYQTEVSQIVSLCMYSSNPCVRHWLYALYFLSIKNALKKTSQNQLYRMLDTIFANNDYTEGDANLLYYVRFRAAQLAGALANKWGANESTNRWKQIEIEGSNEFNEVTCAFERAESGLVEI